METSEDFFDMRNAVKRSIIESKVISGQDQHVTVHGQCSFTWPLNLQKSWIPPFWSKYRLWGPLLTLTLPINDLKVCSRFLRWLRFLKVSLESLESILQLERYLTSFTPVVKFVYWQVTDNFADYYRWVVQHVYNNQLYIIGYIVGYYDKGTPVIFITLTTMLVGSYDISYDIVIWRLSWRPWTG